MIRQAVANRRAVRSASRTALGSAISILVIGIGAVPFVLLSLSWLGCLMATAITAIGVVEYVGYQRLRRAEPGAAKFLGWNQIVFLGLIIAYCILQMATFSTTQMKSSMLSPETRSALAELPGMEKSIDAMAPMFMYGMYSLIIVVSLAMQGGLALYYFTRRRRIEQFNRTTPAWIRRLFVEMGV